MEATLIVFVIGVAVFTLVAAVMDARTKRLPNWLTVPALAAGVVYHMAAGAIDGETWYGGMAGGLGHAAAGFAVGFIPHLILWLVGGTGAGDVKLMGALGAWLGVELTFYTYVVTLLVLVAVTLAKIMRAVLSGAGRKRIKGKRSIVPYGVPVAVATWIVVAWDVFLRGA